MRVCALQVVQEEQQDPKTQPYAVDVSFCSLALVRVLFVCVCALQVVQEKQQDPKTHPYALGVEVQKSGVVFFISFAVGSR